MDLLALPEDDFDVSFACLEAGNFAAPMVDEVENLEFPVIHEQRHLQGPVGCHTDQLPDELWVKIFTHLHLWDRVRAATVCHRWRRASLDCPLWLWSTIPTSRGLEACTFFLKRAQRVPVTFRVQLRHDNIEAFSHIIKEHLPHMRALDLTIPSCSPDEQRVWAAGQMHRCLEASVQGPAPMLEFFRVVNASSLHIDLSAVASLNSHVLHTVKLSGLSLSCLASCAGARNVRSLVIAPLGPRFTQVDWSLLWSFPALESLSLKVAYPTTLPAVDNLFPPTLRRLSLELDLSLFRQVIRLERKLARLDLLRVSFDCCVCPDLYSVITLWRDVVPSSAAIHFDGSLIDMMILDSAGRQRIFQGVRCDRSWYVPFAQATKLSISGLAYLPRMATEAPSPLPELEELTLDLSRSYRGAVSLWNQFPRLACPKLCAVHLRSTQSRPGIDLYALEGVLRHCLGAGPEKLATLLLDGVQVTSLLGDDFRALLDGLAGTVSILQSGDVWPECRSAWGRSWSEIMS